jgi:ABC-2 type transport system permease protein
VIETLIRTLAFVRKEVVDVVRQPMLLLALIVGPFLILLAFGAGLREADPPLSTALVVDEASEVRGEVERFAEEERADERLQIEGLYEDESGPLDRLRDRDLDLVIVFPDEVTERLEEGEQAVIELYHNQIDPIEGQAIELFSRSAVDGINDRTLETVVAELQSTAADGLADQDTTDAADDPDVARYLELDPALVVSPFHGDVEMLAGSQLDLTDFYAPAVVVVLLQHLAVTLLGLSVVRERALGATQLFRVSPLRTGEYLAGKFLSYLLLGGVVAAALLALLVYGLGIPMAGEWWHLAVTLGLLLFTSTALGLVLSLLANTDSQAVQYAMLVLLATIFLSGFLLSLERFVPVAQPLPWILPATYGIAAVRDVMLRGAPLDPVVLGGLGAYGVVFTLIGAKLAHRRLNSPGV